MLIVLILQPRVQHCSCITARVHTVHFILLMHLYLYSTAAVASLHVYTLYTLFCWCIYYTCTALQLHHWTCIHCTLILLMHLLHMYIVQHCCCITPYVHMYTYYLWCIYTCTELQLHHTTSWMHHMHTLYTFTLDASTHAHCTAITTVHVYTLMIWHVYSCVCTYVLYSVHCTHFCGCICTCIAVSEQMYCTCKVYTVHNSADAFSRVQLCLHLCTVNVQCTLYTFLRMHLHVQKVSNQVIAMTQQFLNQLLSFLDRQFFSVARPNKIKFTKF
jgi:hypothetical protein